MPTSPWRPRQARDIPATRHGEVHDVTDFPMSCWLVAVQPGLQQQRRAKVRLLCHRARFQILLDWCKQACRWLVTDFFKPSRHVIGCRTAWHAATCKSPFVVSSDSFPNSIRTTQMGLLPTYHGFFQTISTCRDGLKPQNFPVTSEFHDLCPWLPRDKSPTSSKLPHDTCHGEVFREVGVMERGRIKPGK